MNSENFIHEFQVDELICDGLIEYHKNNKDYKHAGVIVNNDGVHLVDKDVKDSIDVYFYNSCVNPIINKYFDELILNLNIYCDKYKLNTYETSFTNIIQYYPPNGGFKKWHNERPNYGSKGHSIAARALVYTTYLNDISDKGETEFKHQKLKVKPVKGKSIIFPTDFTHTHRGIPSPTQEKWIATGWFETR